MAWHGTVSRDLGRAALDRVLAAPIGARRPARLTPEPWRIADDLGLAKTYDAEYVALYRKMTEVAERLRAADASEMFVTSGIEAVMNGYNGGDPATTE